MKYFFLVSLVLVALNTFADPQKAQTISQKNSKCVVKSTEGEYPRYTVLKNGKGIYSPESDGVSAAIISKSGKYVALSGGEMSLLDIEKGKFEFGVVVVNCESGTIKGYLKGKSTLITKWEDDKGLHIVDFLDLSGTSGETLPK